MKRALAVLCLLLCAGATVRVGAAAGTGSDAESPASRDEPLGDAVRGRALLADRRTSLCLLCHSAPVPEVPQQGDLAPSLAGAGSRFSAGQLRERIAQPARFTPDTIMPAFGAQEGHWRVAPAFRGQTILSPGQIADLAAFLASLRD